MRRQIRHRLSQRNSLSFRELRNIFRIKNQAEHNRMRQLGMGTNPPTGAFPPREKTN